jgi:signal transduction histidine kinase
LNKYQKSLNQFLLAVKQGGFNTTFPQSSKPGEEIFKTFNEIIDTFGVLALKNESQYQFLQALTENIRAGLICFNTSGDISMLNPEAKKFIGKPYIKNIKEIEVVQKGLFDKINVLEAGESGVIKMKSGNVELGTLVHKNTVIINDEELNIILLQDIHNEMEINQLNSWQQLTRVMRHEIMNSLTPIVSLTEAVNSVMGSKKSISSEEEDYKDIMESLGAIENRSKGLLRFVNAYKNFSNPPEIHKILFEISGMLERVEQLFKNKLDEKNIILDISCKPKSLQMEADEELLEGVIINLVKNAIEAMDKQRGKISIVARKTERVHISVADTGMGVKSHVLENIFIPFFTTKEEGSGIGLSLGRQVIQLHGGNISVHSTPGEGTSFHIEI